MERAQEIIKDELASMIEEMQKAKKETPEWLLIEENRMKVADATYSPANGAGRADTRSTACHTASSGML